jgi:uncharacterized protein (TIGR03546 family)
MMRRTIQRLLGGSTPRQVAAGVTLGMILGLVPKENLIAVWLCAMLFMLRVHKGFAVAAAVVFSLASPWVDSFMHKLGVIVLSIDALQPAYAWLYHLPLGPWLGFHNTVVTGALLVGLYFAYPVHWLVSAACSRLQPDATGAGAREPGAKRWESYPQTNPLHGAMP